MHDFLPLRARARIGIDSEYDLAARIVVKKAVNYPNTLVLS